MTFGNETLPITAVVLAGGRSLRMGVDKTQMPVAGEPLVIRAVNSVAHIARQTIVVTNRIDELPIELMPANTQYMTDEVAYQGPLGGLATALSAATEEWTLTCAADMPWISSAVVQFLWNHRANADVVVPVGPSGPEPLLALYRTKPVEKAAREVLASGKRRIIAMFPQLIVVEVPVEQLRAVDPDLMSFFNVNTQADIAQARAYARESGLDAKEECAQGELSADELTDEATEIPHAQKHTVRVMMAADTGRKMPSETPITVYLNDVEVATVQATATYLEDMAVGFLVTEGLLKDRDAFIGVDVDAKRGLVYVTSREDVPDDLVFKTRYVTSGCGKGVTFSSLGHARGLAPITAKLSVESTDLYSWMSEMSLRSEEYRERGGCHSCGIVINGELVLVREDIGRHNAVDKLLGHAWLERLDTERAVLLSSGRMSYEMIVKAAKSRIPFVASRSAATDLAVEIATELGITLTGYVRGGKVLVYSHPERLVSEIEATTLEGEEN